MSIFSRFVVGLSKRIYGIFNSFAISTLVWVMCSAKGWVASIKISKFPSVINSIISSFGSGRAIVSSLPPSFASLAPYSVVVVVKI